MTNADVALSLDDAVEEVLGILTGLDLTYDPTYDRYRVITRMLNRALRANALEQEWGYYAAVENLGNPPAGGNQVRLRSSIRPRITGDDAVRLVTPLTGIPVEWAYVLPRDALHKYASADGLWCAVTREQLIFNRVFSEAEATCELEVPVMREPRMFRLPEVGVEVPAETRAQLLDFDYPDVVIMRAAYYYSLTDPVMQPRAQTLEADYKDLMYQLMERDSRNTDTPYQNEFVLPVQSGLRAPSTHHRHPHSGW